MKDLKQFLLLLIIATAVACNQAPKETAGNPKTDISPVMAGSAPENLTQEKLPPPLPAPSQAQIARRKLESTAYRYKPKEPAIVASRKTIISPEPAETEEAKKPAADEKSELVTVTELSAEPVFSSLQELYKQLEKPAQRFTFLAQNDTVFTGAEGTKITIPAGAFVSEATGKPVSGTVRLELKEYYTLSDILLANLSTKSGKDLLETGGMIHLEAFAGNEKLKLQDGKLVGLNFPTTNFKPGMQLFNGEWKNGQVDWVLPSQAGEKLTVSRSNYKGNRTRSRDTVTFPKFPGSFKAEQKYIYEKDHFPYKRYNWRREKAIGTYQFTVLEDGTITDLFVSKSVDSLLDKAAFNMISNMPKWKPATYNRKPFACETSVSINFGFLKKPKSSQEITASKVAAEKARNVQVRYLPKTRPTLDNQNQVRKLTEEDLKNVAAREVTSYVLNSGKLGWINCDRFIDDNRQKIDLAIATRPEQDLDLKLVYHRYKAVQSANPGNGQFYVQGVPTGEKATVVALKKEQSKLLLAMMETTTSLRVAPELLFEEVTLENLKLRLEKLNEL